MAPDNVERFIAAVKKYPILYNSKRIDYRDIERKREFWEIVREETQLSSVEDCQKFWKSLRDRYIREQRSLELSENWGETGKVVKWPYFEALSFYKDCGRAPRSKKNSSHSGTPPIHHTSNSNLSSANGNIHGTSELSEEAAYNHQAFIEAVLGSVQNLATSTNRPSVSDDDPNATRHSTESATMTISTPMDITPQRPPAAHIPTISYYSSRDSLSPSRSPSLSPTHSYTTGRGEMVVKRESNEEESCGRPMSLVMHDAKRGYGEVNSDEAYDSDQALNLSRLENNAKRIRLEGSVSPRPSNNNVAMDEDEYFALSLVSTLRRLSPKKKTQAKIKILQDLSLAEFGD